MFVGPGIKRSLDLQQNYIGCIETVAFRSYSRLKFFVNILVILCFKFRN